MQAFLDSYVDGAGLATELVNTSPGIWQGDDHLGTLDELTSFLAAHGVEGERPTAADLPAVHDLRARLWTVVDQRDPDVLAAAAPALVATGIGTLALEPDERGRPQWCARPRPDADLAERLALLCGVGILGTLRTLGPERFRECASPTCSGVFIDTSRPGRRRYCMPELCGNRANVAAHRARRREAAG